jgi:hypothetical protein
VEKAFLFLLQDVWRRAIPPLSERQIEILDFFVKNFPNAYTPYAVTRVTSHTSTVYRAVKQLVNYRLILPTPERKLKATVKGALALLVLSGDESYAAQINKIWGTTVESRVLLAYLTLLGMAVQHFGFTLSEVFICHPAGSVAYVTTYLAERCRDNYNFFILQNAMEFLKQYRGTFDFDKLEKLCINDDMCIKYGLCNNNISRKIFKKF